MSEIVEISGPNTNRRQALKVIIGGLAGILLSTKLDQGSKLHPVGASHIYLKISSIPTHKTISDLSTYILNHPEHFPHRIIDILDTDYCELNDCDTVTQDLIRKMISTCTSGSGLEESIISTMMSKYYDGGDVQPTHRSDFVHATNMMMRKDGRLRPDQFIHINATDIGKHMINQGLLSHIDRAKKGYITPPSVLKVGTQYEPHDQIIYNNTPGGVLKMHFNHTKALLDHHNIHTKSTAIGYDEDGSSSNSNRTCLEGVNLTTIDGLLQLVDSFRRGNNDIIVTNRGMTELGHNKGTFSHANGYKVDIARFGISGLMIRLMIHEYCTPVPHKHNQRTHTISQYGCSYQYRILYHDGHFDIVITGSISNTRKRQILGILQNTLTPRSNNSPDATTQHPLFDPHQRKVPNRSII